MRPILRLRRAEMPSTAQRASALILRSNLCRWSSSSSQILSLQDSKDPNPWSERRTAPRSIQSVALVSSVKKARSCEITTKLLRLSRSEASSQEIASISKWLVGSSRSISAGLSPKSFAKAARRRSPPEAVRTNRSGSNFKPSAAISTL